jgi:predicted secreted protein
VVGRLVRILTVVSVLVLASALAGCAGEDEMRTYTDPGTEIVTTVDEAFAIELPINPSTGYEWKVQLPPGLVQRSSEVVADPEMETAEGMVGVPAVQRFEFASEVTGTAELRFELFPPGEGTAAEQTQVFRILTE